MYIVKLNNRRATDTADVRIYTDARGALVIGQRNAHRFSVKDDAALVASCIAGARVVKLKPRT